eukprot:COSAG04_NODE_19674_length_417_cov_1.302251_1_plen_101_part_10
MPILALSSASGLALYNASGPQTWWFRVCSSQGARGNLDLLQGVAGEAAHLEEAKEGTLPPGGGPVVAVVRRGPARPSQVLHDVPRSGRSAQSGFSSRVSGL